MIEQIPSIPLEAWLGLGGGAVILIWGIFEMRQCSVKLVHEWAKLHHYEIITAKQRTWVPFAFPAKSHFFRVKLRDTSGVEKDCWLHMPYFAGYTGNPKHITVVWDDAA